MSDPLCDYGPASVPCPRFYAEHFHAWCPTCQFANWACGVALELGMVTRARDAAMRYHTDEYKNRMDLTAALAAERKAKEEWRGAHDAAQRSVEALTAEVSSLRAELGYAVATTQNMTERLCQQEAELEQLTKDANEEARKFLRADGDLIKARAELERVTKERDEARQKHDALNAKQGFAAYYEQLARATKAESEAAALRSRLADAEDATFQAKKDAQYAAQKRREADDESNRLTDVVAALRSRCETLEGALRRARDVVCDYGTDTELADIDAALAASPAPAAPETTTFSAADAKDAHARAMARDLPPKLARALATPEAPKTLEQEWGEDAVRYYTSDHAGTDCREVASPEALCNMPNQIGQRCSEPKTGHPLPPIHGRRTRGQDTEAVPEVQFTEPRLHPATGFEGETQRCDHPWHAHGAWDSPAPTCGAVYSFGLGPTYACTREPGHVGGHVHAHGGLSVHFGAPTSGVREAREGADPATLPADHPGRVIASLRVRAAQLEAERDEARTHAYGKNAVREWIRGKALEEVRGILKDLEAPPDPDEDAWGRGYDMGWTDALASVSEKMDGLKSSPSKAPEETP